MLIWVIQALDTLVHSLCKSNLFWIIAILSKKKTGKWFLKLSQYSILDVCKMYVGVSWCFEFIFDIFKVGIKKHLILRFVSTSEDEVWKNKDKEKEKKKKQTTSPFKKSMKT